MGNYSDRQNTNTDVSVADLLPPEMDLVSIFSVLVSLPMEPTIGT